MDSLHWNDLEVQVEHELEESCELVISRVDGKPFVVKGWPHMELVVDEDEVEVHDG